MKNSVKNDLSFINFIQLKLQNNQISNFSPAYLLLIFFDFILVLGLCSAHRLHLPVPAEMYRESTMPSSSGGVEHASGCQSSAGSI